MVFDVGFRLSSHRGRVLSFARADCQGFSRDSGRFSPSQGENGCRCGAQERVLCQRAFRGARSYIRQRRVNSLQNVLHLGGYLLITEPQNSITLLVEISRSHRISLPFLLLGMLTAVEFDNQVLLDAAEVSEVSTNPVLPAKFESPEGLGSEMFPELALLVRGLGTKPPAAITRGFPV